MYNSDYNIEDVNVIELLKLSVKWQLDTLSKECSQYMSNTITIENAVMFYSFIVNNAKFCDSSILKYFLSQHFSELFEQGLLKKLSLNNFCTLIADDNINVQAEDVIFSAAMEIINKQTSDADIDRCVSLIRFQHMSADFLLDVVQPHPVMLTQERCLLVREALRYQLTKQPAPTTAKERRGVAPDVAIYYTANNYIYRYIQDNSDVTARLIKRIPRIVARNASIAFHSNKLVVVSGQEVTLINLTESLNIEHLPRLPYHWDGCRVLLNEEGIYVLNCLSKTNQPNHSATYKAHKAKFRGSKNSVTYLSLSKKTWAVAQPMPYAIVSPLVVSHKQYIYVLGSQPGSVSNSLVFWYCTANGTWKHCNHFPTLVNSDDADVLVHDDVINMFTSTTRFQYREDSDTWSADHYVMEGAHVVRVYIKGQHIRCVTRQTPIPGQYAWKGSVAYDQYRSQTVESRQPKYELQTYDVKTSQWIEKHQMKFGNEKANLFF